MKPDLIVLALALLIIGLSAKGTVFSRVQHRRTYWRIKLSGADGAADTTDGAQRKPPATLCGFCGRRPPITRITRLQIAPPSSEFVPIEIPYCGQC